MNKEIFLKKYNITNDDLTKASLNWDTLCDIYEDYLNFRPKLENLASFISNTLMNLDKIHSIRYRTKDPEHLIEKIIRKQKCDVTKLNYHEKITDLIGIRILHLYKDDWEPIHDYILNNWDLLEKPTANVRSGDLEDFFTAYENKGCTIKEHKMGYRSIHYIIKSNVSKKNIACEIQVRTLFEEAWSEIDHDIRYPYEVNNKILQNYLYTFNRLAGTADEMATLLKFIHGEVKHIKTENEDRLIKIKTLLKEANIENKISADIFNELNQIIELSSYTSINNNMVLKEINKNRISEYSLD